MPHAGQSPDVPRYRATRPRGEEGMRVDLMPCTRVRLPTGRTGMAQTATRALDKRMEAIERASELARLRARAQKGLQRLEREAHRQPT